MILINRIVQAVVSGTFGVGWLSTSQVAARFGVRNSWYTRSVIFKAVEMGYLIYDVSTFLNKPGYVFQASENYPQMAAVFPPDVMKEMTNG